MGFAMNITLASATRNGLVVRRNGGNERSSIVISHGNRASSVSEWVLGIFEVLAIGGRCQAEVFLEITVKTAQGGVAAVHGTAQNGLIGIFHEVTGMAQAIVMDVGVEGDAHQFLKKAREVGVVVSQRMGQFGQ